MSRSSLTPSNFSPKCKESRPKGNSSTAPSKKPTNLTNKNGQKRFLTLKLSSGTKIVKQSKRRKSTDRSQRTTGKISNRILQLPGAPVTKSLISLKHKSCLEIMCPIGPLILRGKICLRSEGIIGTLRWLRLKWMILLF